MYYCYALPLTHMYYFYALTHTYYNFFPSSHAGATATPPHTYCVGESEEDNEYAAKLTKHRSQEYDVTLSTAQQLQIQDLRSQTESPCYLYDLRLLLFYARYLCVPLLPTICLKYTIDSVPLRPLSNWYY